MREAAKELGYQPDETFCLKISQLREIFEVRWSVFLLGPAGCGKTAIWKTLMHAQQNFGEKTVYKPINPKVSNNTDIPLMMAPEALRPSLLGSLQFTAVLHTSEQYHRGPQASHCHGMAAESLCGRAARMLGRLHLIHTRM